MGYDGIRISELNHDPFLPLVLAAEHTQSIELVTSVAVAFWNPMTRLIWLTTLMHSPGAIRTWLADKAARQTSSTMHESHELAKFGQVQEKYSCHPEVILER